MAPQQELFVIIYGLLNFCLIFKGIYESKYKKNAYGLTRSLLIFGIFAWGDAIVFGIFWSLVALVTLLLSDWYLFLFVISVFWAVRSLGETIYWFNQQFSSKVYDWNRPEKLPWHNIFHNDSVWYIHQVMWQCLTVISIIASIYFGRLWILSF